MRALVAPLAEQRVLLQKEAVAYYESVADFVVAERDGEVIGCGAVHVLWEDLAEIRTLAVASSALGHGVGTQHPRQPRGPGARAGGGAALLPDLRDRVLRAARVRADRGTGGRSPRSTLELLRSYDEGVAEFLDLERVKPNTWATRGCCASSDPTLFDQLVTKRHPVDPFVTSW